jgi:hypothetical protein
MVEQRSKQLVDIRAGLMVEMMAAYWVYLAVELKAAWMVA